ncbi:hypothetical protein [Flavobacterium aquicola]|nr:hypothetical protein [Flavobacterium aquicola]
MITKYGDSGKRVYVYNSDATISFTESSVALTDQNTTKTGKIWLNEEGEVSKIEEYKDNVLFSKREYTYDDKNNISRNIIGYNKLFLIDVLGITHNILTYKRYDSNNVLNSGYSNKYTYNSDNYPVSRVETSNSGSVYTIEYLY